MLELDHIIVQLERQRAAIDEALDALRGVTNRADARDDAPATPKRLGRPKGSGKKRTLSAAVRRRMSQAQRARWAAHGAAMKTK